MGLSWQGEDGRLDADALRSIRERLERSVEHADAGRDVEHYLDGIAGEAFAAMYPQEVDLESIYLRQRRMSEHVVDAITLATLEREVA